MKIAIIGARGLVGRAIYERLRGEYYVVGITRDNYSMHSGGEYDILINANGNSKKYWANQNPLEDYDASVSSVMSSLFDFKYKKYIFIGSIDAEKPRGHYGFNKRIAEDLVKEYADKWQIVRLCSVIGQNMNKGPVFDIKHGRPVYLTSGSTLQLITAEAVADEIANMIPRELTVKMPEVNNALIRFYSSENITIREIAEILGKSLVIDGTAREEHYNFAPSLGGFKKSWQYLEEIL